MRCYHAMQLPINIPSVCVAMVFDGLEDLQGDAHNKHPDILSRLQSTTRYVSFMSYLRDLEEWCFRWRIDPLHLQRRANDLQPIFHSLNDLQPIFHSLNDLQPIFHSLNDLQPIFHSLAQQWYIPDPTV